MAKKKPVRRRKKVTARSVGLSAPETADVDDAATSALASHIVADGGAALAVYREPFGGTPAVLAALPIERVEPTPYQRDPSEPHVKRLMTVIEKLGRFLDPIIAVRRDDASIGRRTAITGCRRCASWARSRSSRWSCPMPTSPSRSSPSTPRRRTT